MQYNTQQKRMPLPEYGRSIQNMVDYALTIQDRALQDLVYGVRSLEPMPSSRCRMKWFLVCPGVSARFLHGFCTVSKRAKGANRCKIGQRVQKLETQNLRYIAKKLRQNVTSKN